MYSPNNSFCKWSKDRLVMMSDSYVWSNTDDWRKDSDWDADSEWEELNEEDEEDEGDDQSVCGRFIVNNNRLEFVQYIVPGKDNTWDKESVLAVDCYWGGYDDDDKEEDSLEGALDINDLGVLTDTDFENWAKYEEWGDGINWFEDTDSIEDGLFGKYIEMTESSLSSQDEEEEEIDENDKEKEEDNLNMLIIDVPGGLRFYWFNNVFYEVGPAPDNCHKYYFAENEFYIYCPPVCGTIRRHYNSNAVVVDVTEYSISGN